MGSVSRAMNKFPEMLLRSPLHGLMSNRFLLLTFTGRKSGRRYTTPMAYTREFDSGGEAYLMTTDSPWWKNLRGGAPVTLRVKGRELAASGEAATDEAEVTRVLEVLLREQPGYGKYIGLGRGPASRTGLARLARERVVVRARPGAGGSETPAKAAQPVGPVLVVPVLGPFCGPARVGVRRVVLRNTAQLVPILAPSTVFPGVLVL